jgi:hypothetical protein
MVERGPSEVHPVKVSQSRKEHDLISSVICKAPCVSNPARHQLDL